MLLNKVASDFVKGALSPTAKAKTVGKLLYDGGRNVVTSAARSSAKKRNITADVACNHNANCSYYVEGRKVYGN